MKQRAMLEERNFSHSQLPTNPNLCSSLTPERQTLLSQAEKLDNVERAVFADLENQTEEEILETRKSAKLISRTAWRIEAACDAETINRAERAKRGRGLKDTAKKGVMAAVRRRAKAIGCTPNTIFTNAQIFRLMQSTENEKGENSILQLLDEKGYYVAALSAADSNSALQLFAEKKRTLKRFRVSDANRLLVKEGLTKRSVTLKAVQNIQNSIPALMVRKLEIQHIKDTITQVKTLIIPKCPNDTIKRIHEAYLEELDEFIQEFLFNADIALALKKAWMQGNRREDQMSKATGLPTDVVHREMFLLSKMGVYIEITGSGTSQQWHLVGQQLPAELKKRKVG